MSRSEMPRKSFLPFGNPFRMISTKGSHLSQTLWAQLNTFEETLAGRIAKLKPACRDGALHLSWMQCAMESLNGIHSDFQALLTTLELNVCIWKDKWMDVFFDNTMKFLDINAAFNFQVSRLRQETLLLRYGLSDSDVEACESLDVWRQHTAKENPMLEEWISVMDGFSQKLDVPKIKNNPKAEVLMRAMYGVNVVTLLLSSIFAAVFAGSPKKLMDLQVSEKYLWAGAFADFQTFLNAEIRSNYLSGRVPKLSELEAVNAGVKSLNLILVDGVDPGKAKAVHDLGSDLEKNSEGLELLAKELHRFSKIVLAGREELLSKVRIGVIVSDPRRALIEEGHG